MPFAGFVNGEQITMLRRVLDEYLREQGPDGPAESAEAAERLMALYASGLDCPRLLAEALRKETALRRLGASSGTVAPARAAPKNSKQEVGV